MWILKETKCKYLPLVLNKGTPEKINFLKKMCYCSISHLNKNYKKQRKSHVMSIILIPPIKKQLIHLTVCSVIVNVSVQRTNNFMKFDREPKYTALRIILVKYIFLKQIIIWPRHVRHHYNDHLSQSPFYKLLFAFSWK